MQYAYALFGLFSQFIYVTKGNRVGRTGFGASRLDAILLPVITQGALKGSPIVEIEIHYAKGAGRHAIAAAIADIRLQIHVPKLVADQGTRRARLHAARISAVLTHIAHHQPVH